VIHSGHVIKLPDNVDTDIIIPTQYMTLETIEEMVPYAFTPLRPDIPDKVRKGDILICGDNFGCGSSREQAPEIIKLLGFYCVIAKSFARIFYRNSVNNGLLVIENKKIYDRVKEGSKISIDLEMHQIQTYSGELIEFGDFPETVISIIDKGGLVNYYREMNMKDHS